MILFSVFNSRGIVGDLSQEEGVCHVTCVSELYDMMWHNF